MDSTIKGGGLQEAKDLEVMLEVIFPSLDYEGGSRHPQFRV